MRPIRTWKRIPGYPRYEISNLAKVRRLPYINAQGVKMRIKYIETNIIQFYPGTRSMRTASAMLRTFVRPPKVGEVARHLDDNVNNNDLTNLAWGTRKDNAEDAKRNGKLIRSPETKLKLSISAKQRGISSETRKKMNAAKRGKKLTEEHKYKIGMSNLGKKRSKLTKLRISQSLKRRYRLKEG